MEIVTASGSIIRVDDQDALTATAFPWHISHNGYAVRRVREEGGCKRVVYLHRAIMGRSDDRDIDHIDGDKLNNCRSNLRLATRTYNNANSAPREGCSSRFKGVAWLRQCSRWWAYINRDGKRTSLGYFKDEVAAAHAYNAAARKLFGEFARPNII